MIKKWIAVIAAVVFALSLCACSSEMASAEEEIESETSEEMSVGSHGGSTFSEMSPISIVMEGPLAFYPSGNDEYDEAYITATLEIDYLAQDLYYQSIEALEVIANLSMLLDLGKSPEYDSIWSVKNYYNTAFVSFIMADEMLYWGGHENLPFELRIVLEPLKALKASQLIEQSVMRMMYANALYNAAVGQRNPAKKGTHWENVLEVWEESSPILYEMTETADKLSYLLNEIEAVDNGLYLAEMIEAVKAYEELSEYAQDYMKKDATKKEKENIEYILSEYESVLDLNIEETISNLHINTMLCTNTSMMYMLENDKNTPLGYDEAAARLKDAVSAPAPNDHKLTGDGAVEPQLGEMFVAGMIVMKMNQSPSDANDDDDGVMDFLAVIAEEAAKNKGIDPDNAIDVLSARWSTPEEKRTAASEPFYDSDLDIMLIAALDAAQKRSTNPGITSNNDDATLLGSEEMDRLAAMYTADVDRFFNDYKPITIDLDDMTIKVKEVADTLAADDKTTAILDANAPADDGVGYFDDAIYILSSDDDAIWGADSLDSASGSVNFLTYGLAGQIEAGFSFGDADDPFSKIAKEFADDFKDAMVTKTIKDELEELANRFADDPSKAIDDALHSLEKMAETSQGNEHWAPILGELRNMIKTEPIWQGSLDYHNMIKLVDELMNTPTEQHPDTNLDTDPNTDTDMDPYTIPVEFDYSGVYYIELELLNLEITEAPLHPDYHYETQEMWTYEYEFKKGALEDQMYYDWRNPTGYLYVWHKEGERNIHIEHYDELDDLSEECDFILTDGTFYTSKNSTIVFDNITEYGQYYCESNDLFRKTNGELTFIGGDDGSIEITGVLTVYHNPVWQCDTIREFQIHGVLTNNELGEPMYE